MLSPASPNPHVLIAFNAPSLDRFAPAVRAGGTIIYDSSVIDDPPVLPAGVTAHGVPLTRIATGLGKVLVKNIVALGALQRATHLFPADTFLAAIRQALKDKTAMIALNEDAFEQGRCAIVAPTDVDSEPKCARMQADGVPCDCADADCETCAEAAAYAARNKTPS